jgi:hypothetical protein
VNGAYLVCVYVLSACLFVNPSARAGFFFFFFVCVDSCALCFTERKHELTWCNCGYRAHIKSMSSGIHNLVEGGVRQNKPNAGPTNS